MTNLTRRLLILFLLLAVLVSSCSGGQQSASSPSGSGFGSNSGQPARPAEGKPIKFGFLRPITGFASNLGRMQDVGADLAVADINAEGGVNGIPITLVKYDSPFDPKQAGLLVRKLANEDKVFIIFGPFASGEIEVAFPVANELGIPIVNTSSGKPGIPQQNRPWSFRVQVTDEVSLPPIIDKFLKDNPRAKTAVIAGDVKEAVSETVIHQLYPQLLKGKGIQILDTITSETQDVDVSAQVTRLKMLKPDFVAFSGMFAVAAQWAKEMKRQGTSIPVISSTASFQGAFVNLAGPEAAEGFMSVAGFWRENPDPRVKNFVTRFTEKAKEANLPAPGDVSQLESGLYDAITISARTARSAGLTPDTSLDKARLELRKGWETLKDYNGVVAKLSTQPTGEVPVEVTVYKVTNGRWTPLR